MNRAAPTPNPRGIHRISPGYLRLFKYSWSTILDGLNSSGPGPDCVFWPDCIAVTMRFSLIDRIDALEPGKRIAAVKSLSLAEEYLADHFPGFPVMPGVLMLEAMTQASAWLVRVTDSFAHSMVVLKEARNVKYGQFVQPGQTLQVSAEIIDHGESETKVKAQGQMDGQVTLRGQLILRQYNLADEQPEDSVTDASLIEEMRSQLTLLCRGGVGLSALDSAK